MCPLQTGPCGTARVRLVQLAWFMARVMEVGLPHRAPAGFGCCRVCCGQLLFQGMAASSSAKSRSPTLPSEMGHPKSSQKGQCHWYKPSASAWSWY